MAVWQTKACEVFGFAANKYSFARGKTDPFADLIHLASSSADDSKTLDRIVEYVTWAAGQTSDELASAVDLAFFLPMFREKRIYQMLQQRFPPDLLATKTKLLLEDNEAAAP